MSFKVGGGWLHPLLHWPPILSHSHRTTLHFPKLRGAADVPCLSKWERDGKSGWMDPQLSLWAFIFSENYSSTSYSVTQPQPIFLNQCPKQISADVRCLSKQERDVKVDGWICS